MSNFPKDNLLRENVQDDALEGGPRVNLPNTISYPKVNNNAPAGVGSEPKNTNQDADHDKLPKKRVSGKILIIIISSVLAFEYYVYVFLIQSFSIEYFMKKEFFKLGLIFFFHILIAMLVWSLIVTIKTIPGIIPLYWGFYIGDEEYKRKRYCLICNAFKPERSHHCSVCNICVLNMDHHCPWVNNCIGFYNRKFFMQLLFYLFLSLWFILLTSMPEIYRIANHCYISNFKIADSVIVKYILIAPAYLLVCVLTVLNTMFFKFHVTLALNNSTTIESLDQDSKESLKYKLSYTENWVQVFGFDRLLWFFPVFSESGRPNGDGLNWKVSSVYEQ